MEARELSVLFVVRELHVGWPNGQLLDLATGLRARGVSVVVLAGQGRLAHEFARRGVPVELRRLPHGGLSSLLSKRAHDDVLRDVRIVHAWGASAVAPADLLARRARTPLVLTLHDRADAREAPSIASPRIGSIFVVGLATREELVNRRGVPRALVRVANLGIDLVRVGARAPAAPRVDTERFRDSDSLPALGPADLAAPAAPPAPPPPRTRDLLAKERLPVVGALGRLEPLGGHATLLDACAALVSRRRELRLLIGGDGPERTRLFARACERKLLEHVIFAGDLPERGEAFEAFDVFVAPALREGFGHDLLEAMARARPVVATGAGLIYELVEDGKTGLLVPPSDADALASAIERVLADPAAARAMGEAARESVAARFPIGPVVEETLDAYEKALAPSSI